MRFEDVFDLDIALNSMAWSTSQEDYGPTTGWLINSPFNNTFEHDILFLNAKTVGQTNLYEQFLEKTFFKKLEELILSRKVSRLVIPLLNFYEDNEGEKHLIFDLNGYISMLLRARMITEVPDELFSYYDDNEEKLRKFREILLEERKKLNDILKNKENSEYYEKFMQIYKIDYEMSEGEINGKPLTIETSLEGKISYCQHMIIACRYLDRLFKKEVDIKELSKCFNYDKFALSLCYSFLEQMVTSDNKISYGMNYCLHYFKSLEEYRKINPKYNPTLVVFSIEEEQYKKVSALELQDRLNKIIEEHPEFHYYDLGEEKVDLDEIAEFVAEKSEGNELNKKEISTLIKMFFSKTDYENVSQDEIRQNLQDLNETEASNTNEQEKSKIKQQIEKMEFLLENKPVKIIRGKGTFSNYYGYVYANGYVVFDTLDKDVNKSYGNALYVMPYEKMETFSDIKKRKLRSDYKGIIIPIIHKGNWKDRILNILNSHPVIEMDQEEDTIDLSGIIDLEELEELKRLHDNLTQKELSKIEAKKKRIEAMIEIDNELGREPNAELPPTEYYTEVEVAAESSKDFEELFREWQQRHPGVKVKRNPIVAAITKSRARDHDGNYCCELCGVVKDYRSSSFDSHHVVPLSAGGIDNIYNTVCVCPNCHRDIHSGKITLAQHYELFKKIREHIAQDNPEYLPKLEKMISPIAETAEEYEENKEQIDENFSMIWNGENPVLK